MELTRKDLWNSEPLIYWIFQIFIERLVWGIGEASSEFRTPGTGNFETSGLWQYRYYIDLA